MSEKSNNSVVFAILLVIFFLFMALLVFSAYTMKIFKSENDVAQMVNGDKSIAVVEVEGVIMESKTLVELLHIAEKDDETKAIILRINSPGGAVGPTQEIYEEMRRIDSEYDKSQGAKGKPIYASFASVAASGGYYLGAGARKIYSNAGTITGSIGVIMQFMDFSKLYEMAKVKQVNVKAGKYKDIGHPNKEMTQEERDLLDNTIAGVHQQFIRDIMVLRKGKIKGNINDLAQGQIFSGEQAQKLGLVDEVMGLWGAGRAIHKDLKLKGEFGLKFIKKKKKSNFWKVVENFDESITKVNQFIKLLSFNNTPMMMAK